MADEGPAAETPGSARRRRRRHPRPDKPPQPIPAEPKGDEPPHPRHSRSDSGTERGLRDLIGSGKSQLGVQGALRARDVNRPSGDDLAEAERTVTLVRRHWTPPPNH
jgi:hypothetical protein